MIVAEEEKENMDYLFIPFDKDTAEESALSTPLAERPRFL